MNTTFAFRLPWPRVPTPDDILIVHASTERLDEPAFSTAVKHELEKDLVPDEMIVLVRESAFGEIEGQLANATELKARFSRKASATLVAFGARGEETRRKRVWGNGDPYDLPLDVILRRGSTRLFNIRRGFVESTKNYHFENPSGRHTERFVRLANILVRTAEISFLAIPVLKRIPTSARYAYIDTSSLLPLVAGINDHLRYLEPKRPAIIADSFGSYAGLKTYRFAKLEEACVLISASSSCSLAGKVIKREERFDPANIIHILYHGRDRAGLTIAMDLSHHDDENPEGPGHSTHSSMRSGCKLCETGSVAIPLQGEQFDLPGPQRDDILIVRDDVTAACREMFAQLAGSDVLQVGRYGTTSPGRRLYKVSVEKLLGNDRFAKRLSYAARRHVPAAIQHVVLLDKESKPFAEAFVAACGGALSVTYHEDRNKLDPLKDAESPVLIVGAAIESGRTLQELSHDLRSICPNAPQIFAVGIAKSTSDARFDTIKNTLIQCPAPIKHEFIALERMILPPSENVNAWSAELDFLQDESNRSAPTGVSDVFAKRAELLASPSYLTDDLFLDNGDEQQLKIQPGFVFWGSDKATNAGKQADVFFTISSVLQQLRALPVHKERAIRSNWVQQSLLSPENFARFNDGVVQAALLRAAKPEEMNYASEPGRSREMSRIIRRVVLAPDKLRGAAAAEFLLALATRRLKLTDSDYKELCKEPVEGLPPLVSYLLTWCAQHAYGTSS